MIILQYDNEAGTSDVLAEKKAREDIEQVVQLHSAANIPFGNITYLMRWRIEYMTNPKLADFEIELHIPSVEYSLRLYKDGHLGKDQKWPDEIEVYGDQLEEICKLWCLQDKNDKLKQSDSKTIMPVTS